MHLQYSVCTKLEPIGSKIKEITEINLSCENLASMLFTPNELA